MLLKLFFLFLCFCLPLRAADVVKCMFLPDEGADRHDFCPLGCYFPVYFKSREAMPELSVHDKSGCQSEYNELPLNCALDPRNGSRLLCPCFTDDCNFYILERYHDTSDNSQFKKQLRTRYKELTAASVVPATMPNTQTAPNTQTMPSTQTPPSGSSTPETTSTSYTGQPHVSKLLIIGFAILAAAFVIVLVLWYLSNRRLKLRLAALDFKGAKSRMQGPISNLNYYISADATTTVTEISGTTFSPTSITPSEASLKVTKKKKSVSLPPKKPLKKSEKNKGNEKTKKEEKSMKLDGFIATTKEEENQPIPEFHRLEDTQTA